MRTSRRLIDCFLIKGRLVDAQGNRLAGYVRAWIPGQHRGKVYRVLANGRFKIKIHGYYANREIRLVASSLGYNDLTSIIHPHPWLNQKGQFDGYKVVDGGDAVMTLTGPQDLMWFTIGVLAPT